MSTLRLLPLVVFAFLNSTALAAPPKLCAELAALQASLAPGKSAPLPTAVIGTAQCKLEANGINCVARGEASALRQLWSDAARDVDGCIGGEKALRRVERQVDETGTLIQANLVRVWDDWEFDVFFVASKPQLTLHVNRKEGVGKALAEVADWQALQPNPETCATLKTLLLRPEKPALWDLECLYVSSDVSKPDLQVNHDTIRCVVPRLPRSGGIAGALDGVARTLNGCLAGWRLSHSEQTDARDPLPSRISHWEWKDKSWKISGVYSDRVGEASFFFSYRAPPR